MAVKTVREIIQNLVFYWVNNKRGDAQNQNEYRESDAIRLHVPSYKLFTKDTRGLNPLFDGAMQIYEVISIMRSGPYKPYLM